MSSVFRRPALSRRRLTGGFIGAAALALVAIAPVAPAAAEETGGTITFGAHSCDAVVADPLSCPAIHPGALTLVHENGVDLLTMDESVTVDATLVWGSVNPVLLGNYFLDTDYLDVPAGYQLWDMALAYGNGGGSEFGWYVGVSADQPDTALYAVYIPIQTDSDGDGASDEAEIAFGSDPNDPSDFPSAQAGAEDVDSDGDGASDDVEILLGSDPYDPNSWPDGIQAGPDPTDSDGDGAGDGIEIQNGTDPYDPSDFPAVQAGPEEVDSDGDGAYDDIEAAYGSDPYDAADYPAPTGGSTPGNGAYSVVALPNTGAGAAGAAGTSNASILTLVVGGALAAAGAVIRRRRSA